MSTSNGIMSKIIQAVSRCPTKSFEQIDVIRESLVLLQGCSKVTSHFL